MKNLTTPCVMPSYRRSAETPLVQLERQLFGDLNVGNVSEAVVDDRARTTTQIGSSSSARRARGGCVGDFKKRSV